jgi:hypothetical protein
VVQGTRGDTGGGIGGYRAPGVIQERNRGYRAPGVIQEEE